MLGGNGGLSGNRKNPVLAARVKKLTNDKPNLPLLQVKMLPPITKREVMPSEAWSDTWLRNKMCEVTGMPASPGARRECQYCPVVIRLDAFRRPPNSKEKQRRWVCPECQNDIHNNMNDAVTERRDIKDLIDREKAAILMQSHLRSYKVARNYTKQKNGATVLASRMRGIIS